MKTTKRFDNAVTKLYNAFHNGELNAFDCSKCAVGNICDNESNWQYVIINFKEYDLKYYKGKVKSTIDKTGYTCMELGMIEDVFLEEHRYFIGRKNQQFKGLEAVVKYLCELDGIDNVMDYTKVFDYNEKGAVNELKEVI